MDFSATLSMQGETMNKLRQTAAGQISLRGKNLILNGRNLDQEFARFESSQSFNLVDVGAFFFAGPVGLAVTKGYNFASILQGSEGRSEIRTLVSDWKVERGVAQSQDVAMATDKNRVALQGGLDFVNERFDDVTVALIDAKGCIRAQQTIHGAFKHPVVEKPSALKSLTGPVVKLFKQMGQPLSGWRVRSVLRRFGRVTEIRGLQRIAQLRAYLLDTMNIIDKPDAVPQDSEPQDDMDNPTVGVVEAVTSIASSPAVRVQADVRNLSLTVLTVLAVIFALHWGRAFFIPLMLGVMISYAFSPLVNRMQKWRIPRAIGAAVLLIGIVGGAGSLVYSLSDDAAQLIETLPDAAEKFRKTLRKEWGTSNGYDGQDAKGSRST